MIRIHSLLLVLLFSVHGVAAYGQQSVWHRTLADAQRQAREEGRTLLIHFSGNSCSFCVKMDREVFSSPQVQQQLRRSVAAVYLNRDVDIAAALQFGVSRVPTDIIIYPDGTRRDLVGGKSHSRFLELLSDARAHNRPRPATVPSLRSQQQTDRSMATTPIAPAEGNYRVASTPVQPVPTPSSQPADFVEVDMSAGPGLEGFCPVALRELRQWKQGLERHSCEYQGITYRFSSAAARDAFVATPELYAPELQGCDPVILTKDRRAVTGSIRFGVWLDGRLFLFQDAATRRAFKDAPELYSSMRSAAGNGESAATVRQ
jgi:protein disulfide-isomerase